MVQIGLDSLNETAQENRESASLLLSAYRPNEALQAVMSARYGAQDPINVRASGLDDQVLVSLEVLPRRTGVFFEGWEAILLDEGSTERFLYRRDDTNAIEVLWPTGTFREIIGKARREFETLARSMGPGTTRVS